MTKQRFCKRIYVKIERDNDLEYMHASDSADDHAEYGQQVEVAEYKLVRTIHLKTVVKHKK
jgi:hypothetical protein